MRTRGLFQSSLEAFHGRIASRVRRSRRFIISRLRRRRRLAPLAGPEQVSRLMPRMLLDLQNRGQLAAGFATFNPKREKLLDTYKQIGTVIEAFRLNHRAKYDSVMKEFAGRAAIGHVRYATCGANDKQLRPAVRAAPRLQMEVVRLRLQRPAGELHRTPRRAPHQERISPDAQHRHRSHHARTSATS